MLGKYEIRDIGVQRGVTIGVAKVKWIKILRESKQESFKIL